MTVIDDYLDKLSTPQKTELDRIRKIVKTIVPDATETISYGMPTLKYEGKYLIYFAAFTNHMSIFPGSALTESLKDKLGKYKLAKGTIQFTADNPIPESIIKEIVTVRMANIDKAYSKA